MTSNKHVQRLEEWHIFDAIGISLIFSNFACKNGSLLVCIVFSRDRKNVGPRFLSLFGLQEAEFDLARPRRGRARSTSASRRPNKLKKRGHTFSGQEIHYADQQITLLVFWCSTDKFWWASPEKFVRGGSPKFVSIHWFQGIFCRSIQFFCLLFTRKACTTR